MAAADQLDKAPAVRRAPFFRRVWIALAVLSVLLLMALLPPYLNVNRYQRRITQSISESLGRPVHLDHVTLNLLPVPSFTLDRFVVSEDPAFGAEPTIRAESVRATLRVSTLWRRRIEFSTISLTEPSVNLVHKADGRWNLDSILLQASRLDSAPTAQRTAGPSARFPYIEATGARLNLKMDQVKTPIALTEADFAMWLPQPERWNFRIKARPTRTDVPVGYTGLLRLVGTVGRAATLQEIPLNLQGEWRGVPLGELNRVLLGRDGQWRGEATISASVQGTVGKNRMIAGVRLEDLRRQDFVPERLISFTAECAATVTSLFHGLTDGKCRAPAEGDTPTLTVAGDLDDIRQLSGAVGTLDLGPVLASRAVDLVHTLSARVLPGLGLGGMLSGHVTYGVDDAGRLAGSLLLKGGTVRVGSESHDPIVIGDAVLQVDGSETVVSGAGTATRKRTNLALSMARAAPADTALLLMPTTLTLGGREPAVLEGRFSAEGYTLHLSGTGTVERLMELCRAVPQFGDGLSDALPAMAPGVAPPRTAQTPAAAATRLDLVATREWGRPQIWRTAIQRPVVPAKPRRGRKQK